MAPCLTVPSTLIELEGWRVARDDGSGFACGKECRGEGLGLGTVERRRRDGRGGGGNVGVEDGEVGGAGDVCEGEGERGRGVDGPREGREGGEVRHRHCWYHTCSENMRDRAAGSF